MSAATIDLKPSNRLLYAAIAILMAASIGVQLVRDRGWAPFTPPNPTMWLQSASAADKLFLGYKQLVADVYWMRAVVYYGGQRQRHAEGGASTAANYELLYPLLDLVTTLDPRFKTAYRYGAVFLADPPPNGP